MFSVEAILEYLRTCESMECKVLRASDDGATLSGFAALSQATESDVSFWVGRVESVTHANGPSNDELLNVRAGLLFVPMNLAEQDTAGTAPFPHVKNLVAVAEPYHAMVKFLEHFVGNGFNVACRSLPMAI